VNRKKRFDIAFVIGSSLLGTACVIGSIWRFSVGDGLGAVILLWLGIALYWIAAVIGADS